MGRGKTDQTSNQFVRAHGWVRWVVVGTLLLSLSKVEAATPQCDDTDVRGSASVGEDCNLNGSPDACDVAASRVDFESGRGYRLATAFNLGETPRSIIAADFDGNGTIDLATANLNTRGAGLGEVAVLLGRGDGTFGADRHYLAGDNPHDLCAADFDGDHILDLAVANSSTILGRSSVSVLKGRGDGAFELPLDFDSGVNPVAIVAAHFNDDDEFDVAAANYGSGDISVFLGNGDGTLGEEQRFPTEPRPSGIVAQDLDGDTVIDLVTVNGRRSQRFGAHGER